MNITKLRMLARNQGVGTLLAGAWLVWQAGKTRIRRPAILLLMMMALIVLYEVGQRSSPAAVTRTDGKTRYARAEAKPFALEEPLRVTFLDVGKGDAIVLETPGGKCLIVDAGGTLPRGDDRGRTVVAPFLRERKHKRIDLLLLTHPHPDHIGGAKTLIEQFPVVSLVDNGLDSTAKSYKQYREAARKRKVRCVVAARGWCLDCGDGVTLRALAPAKPPASSAFLAGTSGKNIAQAGHTLEWDANGNKEVNNSSIVLRMDYGKTSLLLTGDAEAESEDDMLQTRQPLACDVLKVGHHGSAKSTSARFLQAVKPRYAVISVNADNRNGHPSPQVLERLRRANAQIFRTDENGSITCLSDGRALRIETAR